jgi:hypothetical protein
MGNHSAPPEWDDAFAQRLVGATVLIGLTIVEASGKVDSQIQLYGVVTEATHDIGVVLTLKGEQEGESYTLPPDLRAFHPAAPGSYRLRTTGETIESPDYTTTWTLTKAD